MKILLSPHQGEGVSRKKPAGSRARHAAIAVDVMANINAKQILAKPENAQAEYKRCRDWLDANAYNAYISSIPVPKQGVPKTLDAASQMQLDLIMAPHIKGTHNSAQLVKGANPHDFDWYMDQYFGKKIAEKRSRKPE